MSICKDIMTRISLGIQEYNGAGTSLSALAHVLNDYQLVPGEDFSFIETYAELMNSQNNEILNFLASVLYSVLEADASIKERHSQQMIPNYLNPRIEMDVIRALAKDFVFQNDGKTPLIFTAVANTQLQIELYGFENNIDASYSVNEEKVAPRTFYGLSPTVKAGEQKVFDRRQERPARYSREKYMMKKITIKPNSMLAKIFILHNIRWFLCHQCHQFQQ